MERRDRWGTAKSGISPKVYATPWIANYIGGEFACSHGAALGPNGVGYVGLWNNNTVYRFNYRTGKVQKQFDAGGFVTSTPAIASALNFYVKTDDVHGRLFDVNSKPMDWIWLTPETAYAGSPTIGPDGHIAVDTYAGIAQKLDAFTGEELWSRPGLGSVATSQGGGGTVVFTRDDLSAVVTAGNQVHLLDWSDGSILWEKDLGSPVGQAGVAPDGTIVVGTQSGTIYGLYPTDGEERWHLETLGAQLAPPAFDGNMAYIGNEDTRLYKIDVTTGARKWSFASSNAIVGGPVIGSDHRIYIFNRVGDFYCLSPRKAVLWSVNVGGQARGPFSLGPDGTLYLARNGDGWSDKGGMIMLRCTPAQVAGSVAFTDYLGSVAAMVTLELRVHGNTDADVRNAVKINADGTFATPYNMPFHQTGPGAKGQFDLSLKAWTWLRKTLPIDLQSGSAIGIQFQLVNGDVVNDNVINQADIDAVMEALGSSPWELFGNPRADLNGDGFVDALDIQIVTDNLGMVGDN